MSLPRYPEYKDSGIEWVGNVPAHWEVQAIKRRFTVVGGSTPKSDVTEFWDGDVVWVSPADLSRLTSTQIEDSLRKITQQGLSSCGTTMVPPGSVVLSTRAPIGSLGIAGVPLCTNQGCKALVPAGGSEPKYCYYLLASATIPLNLRGKGTTFLELSGDELSSFRVPWPPNDEQSAIAVFLDRETAKIDALIAEQEKLIALLAEKRQATISHAVTKGLNPDAPMKDSGVPWLGEVPAHWDVVPAKRVSSVFVPQRNKPVLNDGARGINWATMDDLKKEVIESTQLWVDVDAIREAGSRVLQQGAVIASCVGNFGAASINQIEVIINQQLQAYIPSRKVEAKYLRFVVVASQGYFEQVGTAATLVYVNQEGFKSLPIPLPPLAEQNEIDSLLQSVLHRIDQLELESLRSIDLLKERRSALIAAAVTGQIDVRGAVSAEAA